MRFVRISLIAVAAGLLAACGAEQTVEAPPDPVEVSDEATGHYCGMFVSTHDGPKGQIHLASRDEPVWFTSVRDTIAFTRLPEEPRDISAIYVNDMARAQNWNQPEEGTWTDARTAWFVIESDRRGGMGAPEAVPFSDEAAAEAFRTAHGGRLVRFDGVPDDYVLGPVDIELPATSDHAPGHGEHSQAPAGHSRHAGD